MKLKNIFIVLLTLSFFSCSNDKDQDRKARKNRTDGKAAKYEMALALHLYKAVEEYKIAMALVEDQEAIYDEMAKVLHFINAIHSDITQKQTGHIQALESLKAQVVALDEILSNVDWPEEVYERLAQVKAEIEAVQKVLSETSSQQEVEDSAEEGEPTVEGSEGSAQPAGDSADEGTAEEEVPPVGDSADEGTAEEEVPPVGDSANEGTAEEEVPPAEGSAEEGTVEEVPPAEGSADEGTAEDAVPPAEDSANEGTAEEEVPPAEGSADEGTAEEEVPPAGDSANEGTAEEEVPPAGDSANEGTAEEVSITVIPENAPVTVEVEVEINSVVEEDDNNQ